MHPGAGLYRLPGPPSLPVVGARAGRAGSRPGLGSGASRVQSAFDGSDRQGRGRLVDTLRDRPLPAEEAGEALGWSDDAERAGRVVATLLADGLVVEDPPGTLRLAT